MVVVHCWNTNMHKTDNCNDIFHIHIVHFMNVTFMFRSLLKFLDSLFVIFLNHYYVICKKKKKINETSLKHYSWFVIHYYKLAVLQNCYCIWNAAV